MTESDLTDDAFRKEASCALADVDESQIFSSSVGRRRCFPSFLHDELQFGNVLGIGGFGVVREVVSIELIECESARSTSPSDRNDDSLEDVFVRKASPSDYLVSRTKMQACTESSSNFDSSLRDDAHYELALSRGIMVRRCIRGGDCRYAVKSLKKGLTKSEYDQGRLDLAIEVKYLQVLDHPNIVRLRGLFLSDDLLDPDFFFVMDRLYGTLKERIPEWKANLKEENGRFFKQGRKLAMTNLFAERVTAAYDIASAIKYMHSHKLLHRDIKPENIGFDIRGDVKVFDFGLAKSLLPKWRDHNGMYHLTGLTGSFPYMAPEVAKMEEYDEKCDVFSFGIVFWQMLSLEKPFPRLRTRKECFQKISIGGLRPPIPGGKKWSPGIQQILRQCWNESPKNRPHMNAVRDTLRAELVILKMGHQVESRSTMLSEKSRKSLHHSLLKKNGTIQESLISVF